MEAEYGVGIRNRFAFLDDDDDNDDNLPTPVKSPTTKPPTERKPADSRSTGGKQESKSATIAPKRNATKDRVLKGNIQQSVQEEKKNTRENGGGPSAENASRTGGTGSRPRGGGGFRRDPPNRRNFRGRYEDGKEGRQNDAQKDTPDANGQETVETTEDNKEGDVEQPEVPKEDEGEGETAETVEKTFTLTEWKALQTPREKPVFNIRKPGEGEVALKLEKLVLKKRSDDIENQEDEYETDEAYYPQRAGKQKLISDVGFTTGYQKRRGGGRFGSTARVGGGDGHERDANNSVSEQSNMTDKPRDRPRFRPRGGNHRAAQVLRIDDAVDFPTLG